MRLLHTLEYLYLEYEASEVANLDIYNTIKNVKNIEEINELDKKLCKEIQDIKIKFLSRGRELKPSDLKTLNISVHENGSLVAKIKILRRNLNVDPSTNGEWCRLGMTG